MASSLRLRSPRTMGDVDILLSEETGREEAEDGREVRRSTVRVSSATVGRLQARARTGSPEPQQRERPEPSPATQPRVG